MFFTYAVLVYQAMDSKTSGQEYAKVSDVANSTSLLLAAMAKDRKLLMQLHTVFDGKRAVDTLAN